MAYYNDGSRVVYWDDSNQSLTIPGTLTVNNLTGGNQINIPAQSVVFGNLYNPTAYSTNTVLTIGNLYNSNYYNATLLSLNSFAQTFVANGNPSNYHCIAISLTGQFQVAGDFPGYLYVSSDFGLNWLPVAIEAYWNTVGMSQSGQYMYSGEYFTTTGSLWRSTDYGVTWNIVNLLPGTGAWSGQGVSATGQYVLVGGPTAFYVSSDYGTTWRSVFSTIQGGAAAVSATGQYMIIATSQGTGVGVGNAYISSNYGQTWTLGPNSPNNTTGYATVSGTGQYYLVGAEGAGGYPIGALNTIWISSDYGATFSEITATNINNTFYSGFAIDYTGQYMVAITLNYNIAGRVRYSTDYGVTWTISPSLQGSNLVACALSANGQYLTVVGYGGSINVSNTPTTLNVYGNTNVTQKLYASTIVTGSITTNTIATNTLAISSINTPFFNYSTLGANGRLYSSNTDSGRTFLLDVANGNTATFFLPSTSLITPGWNCKAINMNATGGAGGGNLYISSPQASALLYSQSSGGRASVPFINVTTGSITNYNFYAVILYDGSNFYGIH